MYVCEQEREFQIHLDADARINTQKKCMHMDAHAVTASLPTRTHTAAHICKAHTIPDLYIFNSIHPPPAPPPLFPVFVWSYCFNLAASGGP